MVSKDAVICPYCKAENYKRKVLGDSGLVNYCGTSRMVKCNKCGKDFNCEVEVNIKFRTSKY